MDTLPEDAERLAKFAAIEAEFQKEMDDDFNAANGMTVLYQWLKEWNVYLEQEVVSKAVLEVLLEKQQFYLESSVSLKNKKRCSMKLFKR